MANVIIDSANLANIASAIRTKKSVETTYKPKEMADAILSISTSGEVQEKTFTVANSGTTDIRPDSGYDGLSKVTVTVPAGTEGIPTAVKGTVTNNSVEVTPSVSNNAGYITGNTTSGSPVTVTASELVSGNVDITSTTSVDVTNYATAQINDANLVAENIAKDVVVLGITGTHSGGITPTGKIDITTTAEVDVTNYATAQVVDTNLVANNIKNGVSILGIAGSANVYDSVSSIPSSKTTDIIYNTADTSYYI